MSTPGLSTFLLFAAIAVAPPAMANEASAARQGDDCAVASRRFDFRLSASPEAVQPAAALGRAKLRPLVAAPCARGPVAHDI